MQLLTSVSSLFASIILALLSVFVLLKQHRNKINFSFFLYFFVLALWGFGIFGLVSAFESNILLWLRIMCVGVVFIPSAFLYFAYNFLNNGFKPQKLTIIGSFLFSFVYLVFTFTQYFFVGVTKVVYGYVGKPYPGAIFPFFVAYVVVVMVYGHFCILKELKQSKGIRLNQLYYVLIASAIFTIGGLSVVPTLVGFVILGGFPLWNFTNLFYGFLVAYAITKTELMDIRVVINRTTAWVATVIFLGSIYLGLVQLYRSYVSPRIDWLFLVWSILYGILVGETFQRIRFFLQTTGETKFIRGFYNLEKALKTLAEQLVPVFTIEDAVKIIRNLLKEYLQIEKINIYLVDKKEEKISPKYFLFEDVQDYREEMDGAHPFIQNLVKTRKVLFRDQLPQDLKNSITNLKLKESVLYLPLFSSDGLEAIIALGKKASENPYDSKDMILLETIRNQALVVSDRIRPYEEVKENYEKSLKAAERSARLAALGTLALGVAHEIRNPMSIINVQAEMLPQKIENKEFLLKFTDIVPRNVFRIMDIVNRIISFSAPKKTEIKEIDLAQILDEVLTLTESKYEKFNIKVIKDYQTVPLFKGDPNQIFQVFFNIVLNAIEAMEKGGDLHLKVRQSGTDLEVQIEDTGCGIPAEILERIYDPFFTTKAEGIGLGLSTAYRIVESYQGKINIQSSPGKGTTISVVLPLSSP